MLNIYVFTYMWCDHVKWVTCNDFTSIYVPFGLDHEYCYFLKIDSDWYMRVQGRFELCKQNFCNVKLKSRDFIPTNILVFSWSLETIFFYLTIRCLKLKSETLLPQLRLSLSFSLSFLKLSFALCVFSDRLPPSIHPQRALSKHPTL